jgi:quinol monooxygenase YgiN
MIVAVTHFEIKPDKINDLNSKWEPLVQEAMKQKGLHKALLLTSHDKKCMAIGFWDSFENAKAWGSTQTYQNFVNSLKDLMVGKSERHIYSVASGDLSGVVEAKKAA